VTGLIVLEGPDGAGKTTLAQKLIELDVKAGKPTPLYLHGRYWRRHIWSWHAGMLRYAARESRRRLVVIDRHWLSECIYGTAIRQGPAYGASARSMHRHLLHLGALYVLCVTDPEYLVSTWQRLHKQRDELLTKERQVRDIATRYLDLWHGSVVRDPNGDLVEQLSAKGGVRGYANWWCYDVQLMLDRPHRFNTEAKSIRTSAELRQKYAYLSDDGLDHPWAFTTGSPVARTLLVADRSSGRLSPPFAAPGHSSHYLNRKLHEVAADEGDLGLLNINDVTDDEAIRRHLARFKWVVALGGEASRRLIDIGRRADLAIRHPQYARRFQHKGEYKLELLTAINHRKTGDRPDPGAPELRPTQPAATAPTA